MNSRSNRAGWVLALLALAFTTPVAARAADADPPPAPNQGVLTLDEAVGTALGFFPTVRSARARVEGAEAEATEEHGAWVPDLSLKGTVTRYEEPSIVYPIHAFDPGNFPPFNRTVFMGGAFLNYTLFDGGGRINAVRRADRTAEASRASLAGSESEITAQVASTYLQILSRREALEAQDRRLEALRAERDRVLQFQKVGRAAVVESLRVEAALSAAQAERVRFAGDLAQSERDLTGLTGIPQVRTRARNLTGLSLADTALAPADTLVARAFQASPAVVEAERNAAAAHAGEGGAKASRLPRLELTGAYQVWSDPDGNSNNEWNAALQLTQPLITGGELSGRIRKASAARTQADEALRLARITTRRAVLQAADRVRETAARVSGLRAAAARYEEVARIEALSMQTGTGTQTDFLTSEADLLDARASLAEARRAEIMARVELARLTGDLNPDWLRNMLETER